MPDGLHDQRREERRQDLERDEGERRERDPVLDEPLAEELPGCAPGDVVEVARPGREAPGRRDQLELGHAGHGLLAVDLTDSISLRRGGPGRHRADGGSSGLRPRPGGGQALVRTLLPPHRRQSCDRRSWRTSAPDLAIPRLPDGRTSAFAGSSAGGKRSRPGPHPPSVRRLRPRRRRALGPGSRLRDLRHFHPSGARASPASGPSGRSAQISHFRHSRGTHTSHLRR